MRANLGDTTRLVIECGFILLASIIVFCPSLKLLIMSSPPSKVSFAEVLFWNILITAVVFFLVHFVCYGPPVFGSTFEIIQTLLLSVAYAYLYTRASSNWRSDPKTGFLNSPSMISAAASSKIPWLRIGNSLLYSLLTFIIIVTSLYLAGMIMVNLYLFVLEGVRGAVPPPDTRDAGVVLGQVVMAGLGMELLGKTEDGPRI